MKAEVIAINTIKLTPENLAERALLDSWWKLEVLVSSSTHCNFRCDSMTITFQEDKNAHNKR